MRLIVKAVALAVLVCGAASAAETAPAGDPGQEIKEGAVAFGHGVRDGAVRAWGAVKSATHDDGKAAEKPHKAPASKDAAKETK